MIIGIVGSEEAKFTALGKENAFVYLRRLISAPDINEVVSGGCHLGGIDIWAEDVAHEFNKELTVFYPKALIWTGGFKERNISIAERSDMVVCITVDKLPPDYNGMKFDNCYHCNNGVLQAPPHIKSGGCWTMRHARSIGKRGQLIVVIN